MRRTLTATGTAPVGLAGVLAVALAAALAPALGGCLDPRCFNRGDCPGGQTCNVITGRCVPAAAPSPDVSAECRVDADCTGRLTPALACQRVACDAAAGRCVLVAADAGTPCDDANACSEDDACAGDGQCVGTVDCGDGNPCTADVCDPAVGCEHPPAEGPCEDGDPCTGTAEEPDRCVDGTCHAGGANPDCACEADADCLPFEDEDRCNGRLRCDQTQTPPRCAIDPATVVTCPAPADPCRIAACAPATGTCEESAGPDGRACDDGDPCTARDTCRGGICRPGADVCPDCPPDMVSVAGRACMDRYEASRPDATAQSLGVDTSRAVSQPGVLPWFPVGLAEGQAACAAAGKRLCTLDEWYAACSAPDGRAYTYGNTYDPLVCNGIDTFCYCQEGSVCADRDPCPYPHCFLSCGAAHVPLPTGSFPGCVSADGAYDVNGNVWELVDAGDGQAHYRGGAFNCIDSERLHACTYDASTGVSARGFRCCADPLDAGGAR
jgi:hypothetical protein